MLKNMEGLTDGKRLNILMRLRTSL